MLPEGNLLASNSLIFLNTALTATGVLVKGAGTELFHLHFGNTNASVVYLQFYNKATAGTVGTDTPVMTLMIPASAVYAEEYVEPAWFPLGLSVAVTTTATGSTAPGTACLIDLLYK